MLDSSREVIRCLITYTDWMQPPTTSVMKVGAARLDKNFGDGLKEGLLDTVEERAELSYRTARLCEMDRRVLFMWYVQQLHVDDVSDELGISRRQCFRRRKGAIDKIVDMGRADEAA